MASVIVPEFLSVPQRPAKPRAHGITHVIDTGVTPEGAADVLRAAGDAIDIWKTGWGTAYVDRGLERKLALLRGAGVASCLGGTMLEIAWCQGVAGAALDWAAAVGFSHVEVSRGTVPMSPADKRGLIAGAAARFTVLAEVGTKDPADTPIPAVWRAEALDDLDAGAALVVAEGRQSGTVGIYDDAGSPRADVVEALVDAAGAERVVFEAPRTGQQVWFIRRFGPQVNLGNIGLADVLSVETLRLGLRSDTAGLHTVVGPVR